VHGIALAVRAGASGRIYCWAVSAVAVIGVGAFAVSFLALRDLMRAIGCSSATAGVFPAIIDTAVGVATLMLVALGDKPARRTRTANVPSTTHAPPTQQSARRRLRSATAEVMSAARTDARTRAVQHVSLQGSASVQPDPAQTVQSTQTEATQADTDLASELIESGITNQSVETVPAVLAARRDGASINAAAKTSGINYRTAQRIVEAAAEHRRRQLAAVS